MAGNIGAIVDNGAFLSRLPLYNPHLSPSNSKSNFINFRYDSHFSQTLTMAQNGTSEVQVSVRSPKVQKLTHENGESEDVTKSSMRLRVKKLSEKAVLPSRASALSAGYDLSR